MASLGARSETMPALDFPTFLKRFQLQLLGVSTDDVLPGEVVSKAKKGFMPQGHLSELLTAVSEAYWETEQNPANIVYGSVEKEFNLTGKASLSEMGVVVSGGLGKASSATFSITGVSARTFKNGTGHASLFSLTPKVFALKKADKAKWKLVNGKFIVLETYYASEVTVEFTTGGNVDLKADIDEQGAVTASGGATITWKGKRSFTVAKNDKVPFAFRGWQV
jgi:hypothetical protein